jgi:hypothetical protein
LRPVIAKTLKQRCHQQQLLELQQKQQQQHACSQERGGWAAGSEEAVASPSLPAPPAKRKQRRQQQSELPGSVEEMGKDRLCAIPQLDSDGNVSLCLEPVAQPSSPASALSPSALPPPSHSGPASGNKKCSECKVNDLFNYDLNV